MPKFYPFLDSKKFLKDFYQKKCSKTPSKCPFQGLFQHLCRDLSDLRREPFLGLFRPYFNAVDNCQINLLKEIDLTILFTIILDQDNQDKLLLEPSTPARTWNTNLNTFGNKKTLPQGTLHKYCTQIHQNTFHTYWFPLFYIIYKKQIIFNFFLFINSIYAQTRIHRQ